MKPFAILFVLAALLLSVACSHRGNISYKDDVKKALEQAELKDVTVSEDQDKGTRSLSEGRCIPRKQRPKLRT
jgi:hypothetical protein